MLSLLLPLVLLVAVLLLLSVLVLLSCLFYLIFASRCKWEAPCWRVHIYTQ